MTRIDFVSIEGIYLEDLPPSNAIKIKEIIYTKYTIETYSILDSESFTIYEEEYFAINKLMKSGERSFSMLGLYYVIKYLSNLTGLSFTSCEESPTLKITFNNLKSDSNKDIHYKSWYSYLCYVKEHKDRLKLFKDLYIAYDPYFLLSNATVRTCKSPSIELEAYSHDKDTLARLDMVMFRINKFMESVDLPPFTFKCVNLNSSNSATRWYQI